MPLETINFLLALGTLAMQVAAFILLVAHFAPALVPGSREITAAVGRWALPLAFVLALGSALLTLFYSDVLGLEPCSLCWWQRIFLYPQVVLFGMALWRERYLDSAIDASIVLSVAGAGFAFYNHLLQVLPAGALPCPAQGVSCAQRFVFEFGYITFPLMSFSLFVFLIVVMLIARRARQSVLARYEADERIM